MTGNMKKWSWNKAGRGTGMGDLRDAVDIEDACLSIHVRNLRARREKKEARAAEVAADHKRKITLPTIEWVTNFMKDAPDDTTED